MNFHRNFYYYCSFFCFLIVCEVVTSKKYEPNLNSGGFLPSTAKFYQTSAQTSTEYTPKPRSLITSTKTTDSSNDSESLADRTQRFGVSGYGGSTYPGSANGVAPGVYAPLKIDLGGVVLGTLIGLSAILIFPKLAYLFSHGYGGGYGGYGRSLSSTDTSLSDILSNFETALEKHNIDSDICVQRLICTTVQNLQSNNSLTPDQSPTIEQWIDILSTNSLLPDMLNGTSIKEAVNAGINQKGCDDYYSKCVIDKQNILKIITNIIPS